MFNLLTIIMGGVGGGSFRTTAESLEPLRVV